MTIPMIDEIGNRSQLIEMTELLKCNAFFAFKGTCLDNVVLHTCSRSLETSWSSLRDALRLAV